MEITHLTGNILTLSQTFIVNQITNLIEREEKPNLYARYLHQNDQVHKAISSYNLESHITSAEIPSNVILRYLLAIPVFFANVFRHPVYVMRSLNGWKYGIQAWGTNLLYWAVCILNQNGGPVQYDVVHCHFGHRGNIGVFLRDMGVLEGKIVTTFYGRDVSEFPETFGADFYEVLFREGDAFLVLSNHMKQELVELGAPENKIRIHHLGIDTDRFSPPDREVRSNATCHLLSIGRFVEKKGFQYALRAVQRLNEQSGVPEFEYTIAGDGPGRPRLERIIQEGNLSNVHMPGWKSRSDVIELYNEADLFVAPSVTSQEGDEEGTPTVICEAMSMALPVVATRHAGIPEQVEDGKTGLLVDERDVEELCDRLAYLLVNQEARRNMGKQGRQRARSLFNIDRQVDQLLDLYRRLQ